MEIKIHAVQNNSGLVAPTTALAHVLGQNCKAEWRMTIMERLVMNIGGWGGGPVQTQHCMRRHYLDDQLATENPDLEIGADFLYCGGVLVVLRLLRHDTQLGSG